MKTQWIYDKIPENGELIMLLPRINWERQLREFNPNHIEDTGIGDPPEVNIRDFIIVVDYGDDAASFHRRFFVACVHQIGVLGTKEPYWCNSQYDLTRREAINMANRLAFGKYSKVIKH